MPDPEAQGRHHCLRQPSAPVRPADARRPLGRPGSTARLWLQPRLPSRRASRAAPCPVGRVDRPERNPCRGASSPVGSESPCQPREARRSSKVSRGDWIRTSDLYVPNVALYQAELRPDLRGCRQTGICRRHTSSSVHGGRTPDNRSRGTAVETQKPTTRRGAGEPDLRRAGPSASVENTAPVNTAWRLPFLRVPCRHENNDRHPRRTLQTR